MKAIKLNDLPLPIAKVLSDRSAFTNALFTRPESLAALLPYDEFLAKDSLFLLKDGSLGAVYEVELLEHEPMISKRIVEAVDGLKSLFSLPENCTLQFIYDQSLISSFDAQIYDIESNYSDSHSVSKALFQERMEKVKDYLERGEVALYRELKGFVFELNNFKGILKTLEMSSPLVLKRLEASALLDMLRRFFNPHTYYKRSFAPFNKNVPLSVQFLYNSPVLDLSGIEREGTKSRTLTLKTSPFYAYPGGMAYFLKVPFPFKLSLNFSFPTKSKTKLFFDTKEFFLEHGTTAKARLQKEEIKEVQEQLARNDRCLHLTFNVIIEGETEEELNDREKEISRAK